MPLLNMNIQFFSGVKHCWTQSTTSWLRLSTFGCAQVVLSNLHMCRNSFLFHIWKLFLVFWFWFVTCVLASCSGTNRFGIFSNKFISDLWQWFIVFWVSTWVTVNTLFWVIFSVKWITVMSARSFWVFLFRCQQSFLFMFCTFWMCWLVFILISILQCQQDASNLCLWVNSFASWFAGPIPLWIWVCWMI